MKDEKRKQRVLLERFKDNRKKCDEKFINKKHFMVQKLRRYSVLN